MRLAVFTSQFPSRVCTFFARDMRALLEAGIEIDVFPVRPLDPRLWAGVPSILSESILPRSRVHHFGIGRILRSAAFGPPRKVARFLRDAVAVSASAARHGVVPLAKSAYVFPIAWAWSREYAGRYDHILAYWGNYVATCAYICHRLIDRRVPFSIFLHAGADLYGNQVYLKQKLEYADAVITCTEFNREFIGERYAAGANGISEKVHVYYHGLDLGEFPFEVDGRVPGSVLAVGSLERFKGFDYLLRAVQELRRRGVDVGMEVVGDGPEASPLRALANALGIADKVTFRGWLPFDRVRASMRRASVFVHPSSELGDGMPNVLKEAMAAGVPVVASSVAGIPELLGGGKYGVLVRPRDVRGLADAVEGLLANEAHRRRYAAAARGYVEREFDLWRNGRELAELLRATTRRSA